MNPPVVTFDVWVRAVGVYLDRMCCPRGLDMMPAGIDRALRTWFARGVRAWVVAVVLTSVCWPGRATLLADPLVRRPVTDEQRRLREVFKEAA